MFIPTMHNGDAMGFERIAIDNNANGVGLNATLIQPTGAPPMTAARMVCDTQPISYREDGNAPVAGQAVQRAVGDEWWVFGAPNLKKFKAIRNNAANGYIAVTYYR